MFLGIAQMSVQNNLQFLLSQRNLNANSLSEATEGALAQPNGGFFIHIRIIILMNYKKRIK